MKNVIMEIVGVDGYIVKGRHLSVKKWDNWSIVKNVAKIMCEDELSEKDIAKRAGYSEREFKDVLNNNRIITAFDITKLYTALGVDANTLFK